MDLNVRILAKRYARAYMDLDGKVFGSTLEAAARAKLDGLLRVFKSASPHLRMLTHPVLDSGVRLEVLSAALGPDNTGPSAAFAALLVKQGRFGLIEEIMQDCLLRYDEFCGVRRGEVYSRHPLSADELARISALLSGESGKKIMLRNILTERVLGGFEVKIGDTLIDATVRGRLSALRGELIKR